MFRIAVFLIAIFAVPITANTANAASCGPMPSAETNPQCARIAFAQEFVRELEILYRLQQTATQEFAQDKSTTGQLATGIRVGSRTLFEMKDSLNRLNLIKVGGQWAEFRDLLKQIHEKRIETVQEMNLGAKMLLAGPELGVNYGKLAARAPELTATVEELDKSIFDMSKAMFFALVDETRVSADGKLHHLILTKKDRISMVQLIDKMFGAKNLEDEKASRIVGAAWVIKYGLTRPHYKAADEL
jgi:hypothetical protein